MESFRTEIVKTRDLSIFLNLITIGFFLAANYFWVINAFSSTLKYFFGTFCLTGVLLFLSVPFLKPKKMGSLDIDPEGIVFNYQENKVRITLSQIKQLDCRCEGFRRWRNRTVHGNRNFLVLETIGDDYFEFEVLVKGRENKKVLNSMLAAHKNNIPLTSFDLDKEASTW